MINAKCARLGHKNTGKEWRDVLVKKVKVSRIMEKHHTTTCMWGSFRESLAFYTPSLFPFPMVLLSLSFLNLIWFAVNPHLLPPLIKFWELKRSQHVSTCPPDSDCFLPDAFTFMLVQGSCISCWVPQVWQYWAGLFCIVKIYRLSYEL